MQCQDMPECMVGSPQEDHSQPQALPQLQVMSETASSSDKRPVRHDLKSAVTQ